jgi:hypothetical protein
MPKEEDMAPHNDYSSVGIVIVLDDSSGAIAIKFEL